ncbi:MAG: cyclic pyranopterin monophosphate synthase MoaC [Firmicutes bacterium HGW-Firmicutes-20]|jgi:cyclic pyranopterin monophosphate synthase|nr:MAG: cyclic pyranopterin monophosphate synthase MoaC [Firmicutes bacterium HGW-Firmicutes-20]PKM69725.1 MAG: cyclic pyranopterin monophosphate synthase MoaC [Firmicutes bacterium HGW-Firmicutes-19]
MSFTHFNKQGHGQMINVSDKEVTSRKAVAQAVITPNKETYQAILDQRLKKGDVLAVAQIGGIMAVKKTSELIPMAHPLILNGINIEFEMLDESHSIRIMCTVRCEGKTGVEMEALTGASVCALTIYDMAKSMDPSMRIDQIFLLEKEGGKSNHYVRHET